MPIRINLLAEALELEEARRRDPVKRAAFFALAVIGLVLVWSASIQVLMMTEKARLNSLDEEMKKNEPAFEKVKGDQKQLNDVAARLDSLSQLATNRLLQGNILNALQFAVVTNVQLTRIKVNQTYKYTGATKSTTNSVGRVAPGKPATATESASIKLDGRDNSVRAGEQVNRFREALASSTYFADILGTLADGKTNEFRLTSLPPAMQPIGGARPVQSFTVEGQLPDKVR